MGWEGLLAGISGAAGGIRQRYQQDDAIKRQQGEQELEKRRLAVQELLAQVSIQDHADTRAETKRVHDDEMARHWEQNDRENLAAGEKYATNTPIGEIPKETYDTLNKYGQGANLQAENEDALGITPPASLAEDPQAPIPLQVPNSPMPSQAAPAQKYSFKGLLPQRQAKEATDKRASYIAGLPQGDPRRDAAEFDDATGKSMPAALLPQKPLPGRVVTTPGPDGRPITRLATDDELKAGVPAYQKPEKPEKPAKPDGLTPNASLEATLKLRDRFTRETSAAQTVTTQFELMKSSLDAVKKGAAAPGSQGVLVTFQKILDPTSVVRESEYARSASGLKLMSRLEGAWDKISKGGAGVPVADLEQFVSLAEQFVKNQSKSANVTRTQINGIAKEYGLNSENITRELGSGDEASGGATDQADTSPIEEWGRDPKTGKLVKKGVH